MAYELIPNGHVTSPTGFKAGVTSCGIKKGKDDLVILYSEAPTASAAVFTRNRAAAVPVMISREVFQLNNVRAVLINSGSANACTGEKGMADGKATQEKTARVLGLSASQVALASTGRIGELLPVESMLAGIERAAAGLRVDQGRRAAAAILTSDTTIKEIAVKTTIDGKTVTIGGMAKGSGMINPNMATMLSFVTTDGLVDTAFLKKTVSEVVDVSYNMITVDGDTSTNDTVMVLANGTAGNRLLDEHHPEKARFVEALLAVNMGLAMAIIKDGEGATKLVEAVTSGFASTLDARKAAKAVLNSIRVKTSLFAEDGYWGRIIGSLGNAGIDLEMDRMALELSNSRGQSVKVMEKGCPLHYEESRLEQVLKDGHIIITITAAMGEGTARGWGCDLSHDYVDISGFYRHHP
ncbi:MAG: bifunctional glutamate N-acetyltransferase/amino-acid acetyltransferase ArgJ [Bacillota bacterium]|nr:bifunctional glutamate N-acetyltransferase/amino-acid acetyltransferase ArgJ [Bacillota bacterium]